MSVINQMLKDLDKRNPEHNTRTIQSNNVIQNHSPAKVALITAVLVFLLCIIGFYVWHIVSENKALRAENQHHLSATPVKSVAKITPVNDKGIKATAKIALSKSPVVEHITQQADKNTDRVSKAEPIDKFAGDEDNFDVNKVKSLPNKAKVTAPISKAPPIQKHNSVVSITEHRHEQDRQTVVKSPASKMSVSRRQLSAEELAQQKLTLAEKALAAKQVTKAEKLLEDVVIITPNDSQARKKLAALWFGRQAYQDAVNLLSQGIALNAKDSSLREMKARIYLKQGQAKAALNTLKPLAKLKDEQYQIMLANTAQQAQQNDIAIAAYKVLISMKPDAGRWHLGIAVLYDKTSQFNLASNAYKQALTKSDLSISSETFAKQRLQAIGQ